jgi:aspartyl-tRNA(Asn)/glutamyl-tRNA(Gln) amidotransferase subunit B
MLGTMMNMVNDRGIEPEQLHILPEIFTKFINLIKSGAVNRGMGKQIFEAMADAGEGFDPETYAKKHGLGQISDERLIVDTVRQVMDDNAKTVDEYHLGKTKVYGFLVGEAMKRLKGKASPEIINKALKEALEEGR